MKLQIVEYKMSNLLERNIQYRYILCIDRRAVIWSGNVPEKSSGEKVYDKLSSDLANNCKDYNINSYPRFNRIPGEESNVVFEKEVCDSYLKELYVETKMKAIEKDF